jgi:PD-(D/E)XK endonuclease
MGDTSQRGLMSHTAILNRFVQLGFEVLLPWADHLGYDLAYYITEEHRSFGFFVHQVSHLVRVQCKTARLISDGQCLEFNTLSNISAKRGNKRVGYVGRAEYFAAYSPDTGKVYVVAVNEAPKGGSMILRFKSAGLVRGNHKKTYTVPYEEIMDPRFNWAEDYEI